MLAVMAGAGVPATSADKVGEDARVETGVLATLAFDNAVNTAAFLP